jgi:phage terminase small subunit
MSELDDIEYTDPMPESVPVTEDQPGEMPITDQGTIQALSPLPPIASTTPAPKIDSRPPDVQGKPVKKAVKAQKAQKQGKTDQYDLPNNPSLPTLKPKERVFVDRYTDPDSPTYSNMTRSAMQAYGYQYGAAAVKGHELVKSPKIVSWIDAEMKKQGVDTKARVAALADLMYKRSQPRKIRRQVITKDGNVVTLVDRYDPTDSERLKAIDQLNKLSGDYAKAQTAGNLTAQADYKQLMSRTFSQDKARTARADRCKDVTPGPESEQGEGD